VRGKQKNVQSILILPPQIMSLNKQHRHHRIERDQPKVNMKDRLKPVHVSRNDLRFFGGGEVEGGGYGVGAPDRDGVVDYGVD
jgi:hypothetical protein